MPEREHRRSLIRWRTWPVRWRLAGVSAGLTFLILVVFALVVGQLASDKIKDDFEDELLATAQRGAQRRCVQGGPGRAGADLLDLVMAGDAAVRIVDSEGHVIPGGETAGAPDLGRAQHRRAGQVGNFEVASLPLAPSAITPVYLQYAHSRVVAG